MKTRRISSILIAIMLALAGFALFAAHSAKAYAADTYTYEVKEPFKYAGIFKVNGGYWGICCDAGTPASPGTATRSKLGRTSKFARVAYYWGIEKGWYKDSSGDYPYRHTYLKWMMQYLGVGASQWQAAGGYKDSTKRWVEEHIQTALDKCPKTPLEFECYKFDPTGKHQEFIAWKFRETGKMRVKKTSAVPATLKDAQYDLTGCTIKVYEGSKDGDLVHTFVAKDSNRKENGTYVGDWFTAVSGVNYYFQETKAGKKGYELREGYITMSGKANESITVTVENYITGGSVHVRKVTDIPSAKMSSDYDLNGISFRLYRVQAGGDVEVGCLTTRVDGSGCTDSLMVEPGQYYIAEYPEDNRDMIQKGLVLTEPRRSETKNVTSGDVEFVMQNPTRKTSFTVQKDVPDGWSKAGFFFRMQSVETGEVYYPAQYPTGADGKAFFDNMPYGEYVVAEMLTQSQVDAGWRDMTGGGLKVRLNYAYEDQTERYPNYAEPLEGSLEGWKSIVADGSVDTQIPAAKLRELGLSLKGFRFTLTNESDPAQIYAATTDEAGKFRFTHIRAGTYTLKEELTDTQKKIYRPVNPVIHGIIIGAGKTATLPQVGTRPAFAVPNNAVASEAYIRKELTSDSRGGSTDGFSFKMTDRTTGAVFALGPTKNGVTPTIEIPAGSYYLEEIPRGDGYEDVTGPHVVTVEPGKVNVFTYKNRITSRARVRKDLAPGSVPGDLSGFEFTLTNTKNRNLNYVLTTKHDGTSDTIDVEPGIYTVTETKTKKKYTDVTGTQTIEIKAGETKEIQHANFHEGGTAKILKRLSADSKPGGTAKNFHFRITGVDGDANGRVYDLYTKGNAEGNGEAEIRNIPYGTYRVKELLDMDQAESYADLTGAKTFTLTEENDVCTIEWNNKFDPPPGYIKIRKTLSENSAAGGTLKGFRCDIYRIDEGKARKMSAAELGVTESDLITDDNGNIRTLEVDPGYTYRVEEVMTDAQKEKYSDLTGPQTQTVLSGQTAIFSHKNQRDPDGAVTIQKVLTEDSDPTASVAGFHFTIASTNGDPDKVFELVTDRSGFACIEDVPYGTYRITEHMTPQQAAGYINITGTDTFTLSRKDKVHSHAVTWKNKKPISEIRLKKVLTEDSTLNGNETVEGFTFRFNCTSDPTVAPFERTTDYNGEIDVKDIPYGTYEIREVMSEAQKKKYTDETKLVAVTLDKHHPEAAFTWKNRFEDLGELHLKKDVTPHKNGQVLSGFNFVFKSTSASGKTYDRTTDENGEIHIYDVPLGTYTVTENLTPAQQETYTSLTPNPQKMTVTADKTECYINWLNQNDENGEIHLRKTLHEDSAKGGTVKGFVFEFKNKATGEVYTAERTNDEGEIDIREVPFGTYIVTEKLTDYQKKYYTDLTRSQEITLNKKLKEQEISWVNRYDRDFYAIRVNKYLVGSDADTDEEFTFHVDISGLEETEEGDQFTAPQYGVYSLEESGAKIPELYQDSELIDEDHIRITVQMKGEQSLDIEGLPLGAKYIVTEEASDYAPSYVITQLEGIVDKTADSGKSNEDFSTGEGVLKNVTGNKRTIIDFYNKYETDDPSNELQISKHTTDGNTDELFDYEVSLERLAENTPYVVLTEGDQEYTLHISSEGGKVTGSGGEKVAGVPVTIRRSDGKSKLVCTDQEGDIDLSEIARWMQQKSGPITARFLGEEGTFVYGETAADITSTAFEIKEFAAGDEGKAEVSFTLASGQNAWIPGLPGRAKYMAKELPSRYMPSYTITRFDNRSGSAGRLDTDSGESLQRLETEWEEFQKSRSTVDLIAYTNTTDTARLKVTKTSSEENDDTLFDFVLNINGLSRDKYLGVLPGNESATIETTRNGNIRVTVVNSELFASGDLAGIPVRIVKEDGSARTLYTDADGSISAKLYTEWLKQGSGSAFKYTVEFMDQSIEGTFVDTDAQP